MASKIKAKIIDHAVICFARHGFAGSTTKEIAQCADVTEGSLFRLFGSKQNLFVAACDQVKSSILPQDKFEKLLFSGGTLQEGMIQSFVALQTSISADASRFLQFAMLEHPDHWSRIVVPDARVKSIAKRIRLAISKGEARKDLDPTRAATAIFFAMMNLRTNALFVKPSHRAQCDLLEKTIQVWLGGVSR